MSFKTRPNFFTIQSQNLSIEYFYGLQKRRSTGLVRAVALGHQRLGDRVVMCHPMVPTVDRQGSRLKNCERSGQESGQIHSRITFDNIML